MCRYIARLVILLLMTSTVAAASLEEQFTSLMSGKSNEENCFKAKSTFQYCLIRQRDKGLVIVDKKGNEVYQIYYFDNGPDYAQDGLYRIRKNNKIGYADEQTGKIVIEPKYDCAYPFENGKADVGVGCQTQSDGEHSWWVGGKWHEVSKPF